jgi:hypothetical protein
MPLKDAPLIAAIREFAAKRSHQDSQISNENSRSAGQAVILINGGAATAIATLFSKTPVDQNLLVFVPWAVFLYASGVVCGASMIWCMNHALRNWHRSWYEVLIRPTPTGDAGDAQHQIARRWYIGSNVMFGISIACFFVASGLLAYGFWKMQPTAPPCLPG